MSRGTRLGLARDEETASSRSGQYRSGGSMRSAESSYSHGEEHTTRSDSMDENSRTAAKRLLPPSSRGIGHPSILRSIQFDAAQDGLATLPAGKGFPIQIGSESFRLSGASIMSDGQYHHHALPRVY